MQNYSCDAATGNYTNIGWLVNDTDAKTGKHAGLLARLGQPAYFSCCVRPCRASLLCTDDAQCCHGCLNLLALICSRAGYSYTAAGPGGTHIPILVATDESNSTVLGALTTVREAGSIDMPRQGLHTGW